MRRPAAARCHLACRDECAVALASHEDVHPRFPTGSVVPDHRIGAVDATLVHPARPAAAGAGLSNVLERVSGSANEDFKPVVCISADCGSALEIAAERLESERVPAAVWEHLPVVVERSIDPADEEFQASVVVDSNRRVGRTLAAHPIPAGPTVAWGRLVDMPDS